MYSIIAHAPNLGVFHLNHHLRRPRINLMLSSASLNCSGLRRPLPLVSTFPNSRVPKLSPEINSLAPITRGLRVSGHHCRYVKKWKITCFRNEDSAGINPELIGDGIVDELQKSEGEKLNPAGKNWTSSLKGFSDAVLGVFGKPWTVPWTVDTIVQVTLLWVVSFWFVGNWMIPFAAHMVGFNKESLTYRGQALFSLITDVAEGLAGISILYQCLSRFRPLPEDWFKFNLKGKWLVDVMIGCLMFPLVNRLSQLNLDLLPILPSTPVTFSSVEHSIMARDPVAMGMYALVLVVCAPLWEEIVFRGFLLPSLTKYMPVWCSVLMSSVAFALAHFNVQRMIPLIFLGVVMGVIYARSRSLLPSILLHSLWNGFVFLDLMK